MPRHGRGEKPLSETTTMTNPAAVAPIPNVTVSTVNPGFPAWTFDIPADVVARGFQIAIYGQDPITNDWMYWNPTASGYVTFAASTTGQDTTPLISATSTSLAVQLPGTQQLQSGVVAMFIGGSTGIPVASGVPASPTTSTNPDDLYSLFEFTYAIAAGGTQASLDIDISNVDQVGFTYTVQSASAPFPMALVGSSVPQGTLFSRFAAAFPAGTPFNECMLYGQQTVGGTAKQLRLLAPQDVLQAIMPPSAPSYLAPTGTPTDPEAFADHTYFYLVSETSPSGETAPNPQGVFGGFLLSDKGVPQASGIDVGWQVGGKPVPYAPANASTTGIHVYRASAPAVNAGSPAPPAPTAGYGLLTSQTIAEWNAQTGNVFLDQSTGVGSQAPKPSSYGFSALATWFDLPLQQFFEHYAANTFALYQFNQSGGSNGTLWTGRVADVTPKTGDAITSLTYQDEKGTATSITTQWTWGDGTQTYKVLQLVGNAYDADNLSNTDIANATTPTSGEYQGAVVNVYFPYFTGNTGLSSILLPGGTVYTLPSAPSWLNNAVNGPSQMVFGCAGTFATPNDLDAVAQQASMPYLAERALTNLQNVIVSALNRGIATGYGFALSPLGYTCQYGFSQAPAMVDVLVAGIPAGTYTYYLSGTLNDGTETVLSWPQTITVSPGQAVSLQWLPQPVSLYRQANVYRQTGTGPIQRIATIQNASGNLASSYLDGGQGNPAQPTNGAPFTFYPSWSDASAAGFVHSNLFSAFLHQNASADTNGVSINGLVYGYPFDDQGNFSTNINYGTAIPASNTFAITPLS
jgi:hypothetical protein